MIQEQFFPVFYFFGQDVKYFYQKKTKQFANAYSTSENDLKHEIPLAKELLQKKSQLPVSLEQILSFITPYNSCVWLFVQVVTNSCNSSRRQRFMQEKFFKKEISENIYSIRNSMTSERLSNVALLSSERL